MKEHNFYVYILTTANHKMFYTGITNDLIRRVYEHKHKLLGGFTKQYNVTKLVYFEHHTDVNEAIMREKKIKKWKRVFKVGEIEKMNPNWDDLYSGITQQSPQLATLARGDN